jgi:hypothetical protein
VHELTLAAEYDPERQLTQAVDPAFPWYFPASHPLHALAPAAALLRLAHTFEVGEGGALGGNATVALARLFAPAALRVVAAVEMTLTGGQPLADVAPVTYRWRDAAGEPASVTLPAVPAPPAGADLTITLTPMQIRTFRVTFAGAPASDVRRV